MTEKLVTVGIPTFNRARYLEQRLLELELQYDGSFEILVSDNGSTDDTEQLVRSYQARMPYLRYVRLEKNYGVDRNILSLYRHTRTPFIWFVSDSYKIAGKVITELSALLERYDPTVAFVGVLAPDEVASRYAGQMPTFFERLSDLPNYDVLQRMSMLSVIVLKKLPELPLEQLSRYEGTWFMQATLVLHLLELRFRLLNSPATIGSTKEVNYISSREYLQFWLIGFMRAVKMPHLSFDYTKFKKLMVKSLPGYTATLLHSKIGTYRLNRSTSREAAREAVELLGVRAYAFLIAGAFVNVAPSGLVKAAYAGKCILRRGLRDGLEHYRFMSSRAAMQDRVSSY